MDNHYIVHSMQIDNQRNLLRKSYWLASPMLRVLLWRFFLLMQNLIEFMNPRTFNFSVTTKLLKLEKAALHLGVTWTCCRATWPALLVTFLLIVWLVTWFNNNLLFLFIKLILIIVSVRKENFPFEAVGSLWMANSKAGRSFFSLGNWSSSIIKNALIVY